MKHEEQVNILLVDDRPENLDALESVLAEFGQNLVRAASGREALRRVLQQDFAAILLDVQMPGMDGFETAELIRERERSQHTPIIFITAIGKSEPEVFKGYSVGAVDYVFKPFVPEILKAKVRVFVDLFQMRRQIEQQAAQLAASNQQLKLTNLKLEALNHELEAFSYSVSHDLRAPLRGIDGFSRILMDEFADQLNEKGRGYLQRIQAATERMGQMIEGLLALSRVTREELRHAPVDLTALAREIAADLQQRDPGRAELVEFVIAEHVTAEGDARLLRIALENLLGNAWKYTGKHERARIEFGISDFPISDFGLQISEGNAPQSAIRIPQSDVRNPTFFVRDDGAGFDPAYAEKIFGAFQRLHSSNEFPGLGIGLATVQRIIRRHGGRLWAEGEVEKGAAFYFALGQL